MTQRVLILMAIVLLAFPVFSQNVDIPDAKFLLTLIEQGVDTDGDSLISYAEAEGISSLNVQNKKISNLAGIEAFVNLITLNCTSNQLTSLDISKNTSLKVLLCFLNQLGTLGRLMNHCH